MPQQYQQQLSSDDESLRKLFLGGLDREKTMEPQLKEYFGVYGTVADCVVIKDSTTQASKGFGFVTMSTVDETDNVLLDKDSDEPHIINKKKVEVKRAIPRGRDILPDPIKKLFVAGFRDSNLTEEDLKNHFGEKCTVEKVHLVKDKETGKAKGFGFVELSNRHMVDKAAIIEKHDINGIQVVAKKATPKGDEAGAGGGRFGGGRGRGGGGARGRGGFSSYSGGGSYGGGDSYGYGGDSSESYGYGGDRYGGGRGRGGRGGSSYSGRGGGGSSGGYGGSSGSSWGGNGYDSWGSGSGGYEAGSNYAGSSSSYGPMKGYGSGGSGYGSGSGSYGSGGGGGGGYGSGGYSGGGRGGRPY